VAFALSAWSGNWQQWVAVAFGAHVAITYAQRLKRTDPPAYALIFKTRSLGLATLGFSLLAFNGYSVMFWVPAFYVRYHGLPLAEIGLMIGLISSICGLIGVTLGGLLADRFRRKSPAGRLFVGMTNALGPIPFTLLFLYTSDPNLSLAMFAMVQIFASLWVGAGVSTVQDLVLPRMRARASAVFLLFVTLLGLALGPFLIGRISDFLGDLRQAMLFGLVACLGAFVLFVAAARSVGSDEASRGDRARDAGETVTKM
jgi:MFS family permease